MDEELLEAIKLSIRIKHNFLDDEILDLIEQCRYDIQTKSLKFNPRNPKHRSACKYFCQRSLLDESFEKLNRVYNSIIKELMLDSDKGSGDVDEL